MKDLLDIGHMLLNAVLILVAFGAGFWAYWNLVGFPMMDQSEINTGQGWVSLGIAILAAGVEVWLYVRAKRSDVN